MKTRAPAPYRDLSELLRDNVTRSRVARIVARFEEPGASRAEAARAARQAAIIARCDLGGELHKVVASDLGVSMRTFYRERCDAFERLRRALEVDDPFEVTNEPAPVPTEAACERARSLAAEGRLSHARAALRELVLQERDPSRAATIHARLARLAFRCGDLSGGDDGLSRARRVAAMLGNGAQHAAAQAEIALAEATRLRERSALAGSAGVAASLAGVVPVRPPALGNGAAETRRIAAALYADLCLELGASDHFTTAVAAATCAAADPSCTAETRLEVALIAAEAAFITDAEPAAALAAGTAVHSQAVAGGFPRHAVRALRLIAVANATLGNAHAAKTALRSALATLEQLEGGERIRARLDVALAASDLDDAQLIGDALESEGNTAGREGLCASLHHLASAEAALLHRRLADAIEHAREAVSLAAPCGSRRWNGEASFVLARVLRARGEDHAARRAAADAAALLRGTTWPARAAAALALTDAVTPIRRGTSARSARLTAS